ncbi:sugar-binding transcriptional regulator [Micrococcales bacterium 31B]|nr:sugar-binding transcriptional regulator [Micrococcales bacterium 31B]
MAESEAIRSQNALAAAQMYYLDHMKMETIARELRTSRSTVSRYLKYARETGIVEIKLRSPNLRPPHVQLTLAQRLGISVHVVPLAEATDAATILDRVARVAALVVSDQVTTDCVIATAWGTTVSAVSKHLSSREVSGCHVVQLNGAGSHHSTGIEYASDILSRFGAAYNATVHQFPVPAFFDFAATKDAMWRERSIQRILDLQRRADLAVFSIGAFRSGIPSHVHASGYLEPADYHTLMRHRVVGDVCTYFLRLDGSSEGIEVNARSSGCPPEALRHITRRVCVVVGASKVLGTVAALEVGLITELVIDERTAVKLAHHFGLV